ncbi:MAG: ribose 5-phosphate isomerase B [Dehalococcoidia bacterium]|nr:ribose 5-phosphate isomerase B [Dehalococcoidia bacterium]
MRVAIGSDHAGFELKEILRAELAALGDEVADYGTDSLESCDYPDIAVPLAEAVAGGQHDFGILICSNGVGPSVVSNKIHGVRAAVCHDTFSAKRAREHTDVNVLCLGAWAIGRGVASEVMRAFRAASFEGGRHERRLNKVKAVDDAMRARQAAASESGS